MFKPLRKRERRERNKSEKKLKGRKRKRNPCKEKVSPASNEAFT